ncbi:hypothetical protein LV779_36155 [Streptomyces thinghirensis]|nr:hypothetical protein [Streptomyces thinghirensis]
MAAETGLLSGADLATALAHGLEVEQHGPRRPGRAGTGGRLDLGAGSLDRTARSSSMADHSVHSDPGGLGPARRALRHNRRPQPLGLPLTELSQHDIEQLGSSGGCRKWTSSGLEDILPLSPDAGGAAVPLPLRAGRRDVLRGAARLRHRGRLLDAARAAGRAVPRARPTAPEPARAGFRQVDSGRPCRPIPRQGRSSMGRARPVAPPSMPTRRASWPGLAAKEHARRLPTRDRAAPAALLPGAPGRRTPPPHHDQAHHIPLDGCGRCHCSCAS